MEKTTKPWTLGDVAAWVGGSLVGDAALPISGPAPSDGDDPTGITFAENEAYLAKAEASPAAAILVKTGTETVKPRIEVESPRMAFGALLTRAARPLPLNSGIHATAVVDPSATVEEGAQVGPYAVVERGAFIGAGARIYPFCYIGENCQVGARSVLAPHVVLAQDVHVGEGAVIHPGAVLGADGFGFVWTGAAHFKVPQIGRVELGDNVEVGANTTIDRATVGATRVGSGTKIDNLVQVGHNVSIGKDGAIAAQTGIAGSAKIGDRVIMGGSCGLNDHVTVGDDITLGGRTGVAQDITEPGQYFGTPAQPVREALRVLMHVTKLPQLAQRIRELEKAIKNR